MLEKQVMDLIEESCFAAERSDMQLVSSESISRKSPLTRERQIFPSYRNASIDLWCKSIRWFLYDGNILACQTEFPPEEKLA